MKKFIISLILTILTVCAFAFSACGDNTYKQGDNTDIQIKNEIPAATHSIIKPEFEPEMKFITIISSYERQEEMKEQYAECIQDRPENVTRLTEFKSGLDGDADFYKKNSYIVVKYAHSSSIEKINFTLAYKNGDTLCLLFTVKDPECVDADLRFDIFIIVTDKLPEDTLAKIEKRNLYKEK